MHGKPIPKIDNPTSEKDNRPVSVLSALSKVFEWPVLKQLILYIDRQSLFVPCILGFCKGHSTTSVLLGIWDDIIGAMRTVIISHHVYSQQESFALRSQKYHDQEFRTCLGQLKANRLLSYRGAWCFQGEKPNNSQRPIPCRITCQQPQASSIAICEFDKPVRVVNYGILRKVKHQKSYDIPVILLTNIRALTNKVDEISETWLSPSVPDSCVAIPDYNLFRKDRVTTGGGVCIYLDHKVHVKSSHQENRVMQYA